MTPEEYSVFQDTIIDKFPYPIASCYYRFVNIEEAGTGKFATLMDIAESYLHYLATVLLSSYAIESTPNPELTFRLIEKFRKGKWGCGDYVEMIREICRFYQNQPEKLPYPDLLILVKKHLTNIEEISTIRNKKWGTSHR